MHLRIRRAKRFDNQKCTQIAVKIDCALLLLRCVKQKIEFSVSSHGCLYDDSVGLGDVLGCFYISDNIMAGSAILSDK